MRNIIVLALVVAVIALGSVLTLSRYAPKPSPPPGVPPDRWVRITDDLGLIIHLDGKPLVGQRFLEGTLMVREGPKWLPVAVFLPPRFAYPGPLPAR